MSKMTDKDLKILKQFVERELLLARAGWDTIDSLTSMEKLHKKLATQLAKLTKK